MSPGDDAMPSPYCAVTGANGYVGSRIVRHLRTIGCRVREFRHDLSAKDPEDTESVPYSLREGARAEDLAGVDVLIHCAYDFRPRSWPEIERSNVDGSRRLFDLARAAGDCRIIHVSSMSAFSGCRSLYGKSKRAIEGIAAALGGLSVRPGLVWGDEPGGTLGSLQRLVSLLPLIPLVGDGGHLLHLAHEDDLVRLIERLVMDPPDDRPEVIVAAAPSPLSLRQILEALAVRQAKRARLVPVPEALILTLLRLPELIGLRLGLRSDSLVSLVNQDPSPDFTPLRRLGVAFREPRLMARAPTIDSAGFRGRFGVSAANRDTEEFADLIAAQRPESFLDIGSGTGYVAIRLAQENSRVVAADISPTAVAQTEENARRLGIEVKAVTSDLFEHLDGTYQAIAFNPPFSERVDGPGLARLKQIIRRIGPLERFLMRRMPAGVAAFRRRLVFRFIVEAIGYLEPAGALYLLLYVDEIDALSDVTKDLIVEELASAALLERNLACVRLTRSKS